MGPCFVDISAVFNVVLLMFQLQPNTPFFMQTFGLSRLDMCENFSLFCSRIYWDYITFTIKNPVFCELCSHCQQKNALKREAEMRLRLLQRQSEIFWTCLNCLQSCVKCQITKQIHHLFCSLNNAGCLCICISITKKLLMSLKQVLQVF